MLNIGLTFIIILYIDYTVLIVNNTKLVVIKEKNDNIINF